MKKPIGLLLTIFALAALAACAETTDETPSDAYADGDMETSGEMDSEEAADTAEDIPPDDNACSQGILSNKLSLAWEDLNHRISWMKLAPCSNACMDACEADTLDTAFIGGDFTTGEMMTDTPIVGYGAKKVNADGALGFHFGTKSLTIEGEPHTKEAEITLSLEEAGLLGFDEYVAVINGFELDTRIEQNEGYPDDYEARFGYTSGGLGIRLGMVTLDGDTLSFPLAVRFAHAPSDRDNMNRAIPQAKTSAKVHYAVIGVEDGHVAYGNTSYRTTYPKPDYFTEQTIDHAPLEERKTPISASASLPEGIALWTQFWFTLDPDAEADGEAHEAPIGYYIRQYSVEASVISFDQESGEAILDLDGYVSNSTSALAFYGLDALFEGQAAFIQFPTGEIRFCNLEKAFETGEASFPLDDCFSTR